MKYLVGIALLVVGGIVGYFIGSTNSQNQVTVDESPKTEFITQTVHDTIVKTEQINVEPQVEEVDSIQVFNDSLNPVTDSLALAELEDSLNQEISISREEMEKSVWINVKVLQEFEDKDSLIKEMLGIEENMPNKILVEFWHSPLNFSGYKLSKSKLLLYGMPSQLEYKLFRKKEVYYLSTQNVYYALKETDDFLSYSEVSKEVVFND